MSVDLSQPPAYGISTCGRVKATGPAPAIQFYRGTFIASQGRAVTALHPRGGRLILSNKYGFMRPNFVIPGPYDSHWGYPDTMADELLREQIGTLDLRPGDWVVNFGAREYARQTRRLFPDFVTVVWPAMHLEDQRMGYQTQMHAQIARRGSLPRVCRGCEFTHDQV